MAITDIKLRGPREAAGGLADQVYLELRQAICDSRIPANERLVQNTLAAELGISRTPVRDALMQLYQEGLVRPAPSRGGYIVTPFTPREVLHIYDVRQALEPLAARQSVGKLNNTQLGEMRDVNDEIGGRPEISLREHYELNSRFHQLAAAGCGNPIIIQMLRQLWAMPSSMRLYHNQVLDPDFHLIVQREHEGIIEAFESGDAELVERRLSEHIEAARQAALRHFEDFEEEI